MRIPGHIWIIPDGHRMGNGKGPAQRKGRPKPLAGLKLFFLCKDLAYRNSPMMALQWKNKRPSVQTPPSTSLCYGVECGRAGRQLTGGGHTDSPMFPKELLLHPQTHRQGGMWVQFLVNLHGSGLSSLFGYKEYEPGKITLSRGAFPGWTLISTLGRRRD